ncbi:TetR/AcrR family transcriptional regulator [Aestuariimicrobium sp. p3-SID1156]|uniref:TetR/AcrR family transcriptional regulator n=1 Tax=Aestuariimicrobium sp. p3-SID1156 TaxID=2916038 RepID=UPI00223B2C24|nr:TetR/AcrR family transcriptional regulator [Aestuariimicrobium sp. p3-SID1156]MCT1458184.1 TetR/AcrR family transcriptional regulator [Aestuariimicrobium sp. p3-SID1156]
MSTTARHRHATSPRTTASRARLFTAAMDLVGDVGPDKVTVDEIAAAAGVAKGTVYYQFGSKNELIRGLIDHGYSVMRDELLEPASAPDPMEAIEGMIRETLDFLDEYGSFAKLWHSEMWLVESPWGEQLRQMRREILALICQSLARLGASRSGIRPEVFAITLFGATYITGMDAKLGNDEIPTEDRVAALMAIVRGYLS